MKNAILLIMLMLSVTCFSQVRDTTDDNTKTTLNQQSSNLQKFEICCETKFVGLIDFQFAQNPQIKQLCNTLGTVKIYREGPGVYTIDTQNGFNCGNTWVYIQGGASAGTNFELQINCQPNGTISIQVYQAGVLSDTVLQNVSFEIRVYPECLN